MRQNTSTTPAGFGALSIAQPPRRLMDELTTEHGKLSGTLPLAALTVEAGRAEDREVMEKGIKGTSEDP